MTAITYLVDVGVLSFDEKDGVESSWIHALPLGSYKHPVYGTIDVPVERAKRFAESVTNKVRGTVEPSINYVHNNSDVAAGWVKDAGLRSDGLWIFVEWVKEAAQAIKDKKWRYFSSEFVDDYEDPQSGTKFKDVFIGGALTNRPFMKNLVPINLSEATLDTAFELVSLVSGTTVDDLKGGNMDLSEDQLNKIVEGVSTKLAEKKVTNDPSMSKLIDIPELKELAESNPMVALLIKTVENQNLNLSTKEKELKEADVQRKLADFDRSKIVLTPVARQLAATLAMEMPVELQESFWKLLTEMKRGSSFLVELGERAGATVNYGSPKTAEKQFNELAAKLKTENKLSDADAYERAAADNPALYRSYRSELNEVNV